jgi:uncharacterized protein involved in copper resistance
MVTLHEPVPLQAPAQPAKNDPAFATAASVTVVPEPKTAVQAGAQLIPAGLLVALPPPVPAKRTDSRNEAASGGAMAEPDAGDATTSPCAEPFRTNPALKHAATESKFHRVTNQPPRTDLERRLDGGAGQTVVMAARKIGAHQSHFRASGVLATVV